jgi:hypothetical protein
MSYPEVKKKLDCLCDDKANSMKIRRLIGELKRRDWVSKLGF